MQMYQKKPNESEEEYIWRLGNLKDSGMTDLDWDALSDLINKECRSDESEYRTSSAYRKPYQQAKRFYDAGVFNKSTDDVIRDIEEKKNELRKERQKLSDERAAMNRVLRNDARVEQDLSYLKTLVQENGQKTLKPVCKIREDNSKTDIIACLSDFHFGLDVANTFGAYDPQIAEHMLSEYVAEIVKIKHRHNSECLYLLLLGDLINGEIHYTTQLENRECVTKQVQQCAELLSAFMYELSKHFSTVFVNGVAGNHSRTSYKDQVLRNNRLDNLIPWYMKAKLSHIDSIQFLDGGNIDDTIANIVVRGRSYVAVHGDYDDFSKSGVSNLVMKIGYKPTGIFFGHMHRCSLDDIYSITLIRSGSFTGTADDYTVTKRITGEPQQAVCVVSDRGIENLYPVKL